MNDANKPKRDKWPTRSSLIWWAFISIVSAVICLTLCVKTYIGGFVWLDQNPNPTAIKSASEMLKVTWFKLMPVVSALLIINSFVLLACCRKFYTKPDK
jgi:hypothetical protein